MVSDDAIDSFIIGNSITGMKLNDNFFCWLFSYDSFGLAEIKNIARLSKKLEICLNLRRISDCKNFTRKRVKFNFIKVNRIGAEWYVISFWVAFALKINLVSALANHLKLANIIIISKSWCVNDFDCETHLRRNIAKAWLN